MNVLAFEEFTPQELRETGRCIWCGESAQTNRAHIISKKLTMGALNAPVLRFRVCAACNSLCGELELWILRRTPLSFLRSMLYVGRTPTNQFGTLSLFYSETFREWVIFQLDSQNQRYVISTQLIFASGQEPMMLTEEPEEQHQALIDAIKSTLHRDRVRTELSPFPDDFSPRLLLLGIDRAVVIARSSADANRVMRDAASTASTPKGRIRKRSNPDGRERHHFKWSRQNWARFCAKTALEALCLFEGGESCLREEYKRVRDFVLNGEHSDGYEVIFDKAGPVDESSVPTPVYLDLTNGQEAPEYIRQILPDVDPGSHIVLLYEIRGWVVASLGFAGLPPSTLILAGPDAHLKDFYQLIYDHGGGEYHFLRLAGTSGKPIIPIPIPGDRFDDLVETYRLKSN